MKAIITAAGKQHRHLPLQTVTAAGGYPVSILELQLQQLREAGIDQVGIVTNPHDVTMLRDSLGAKGGDVVFLPQTEARGYAHAILCAEEFAGGNRFVLTVGDHLFVSRDPAENCFAQVIAAAEEQGLPVSAIQPTPERDIIRFGTVGGERVEGSTDRILIRHMLEKPTPTAAEQQLFVSGLKTGHYYCFFGIHVLPPDLFPVLRRVLEEQPDRRPSLTDALQLWLRDHDLIGFEVHGRRYDLEASFGLLEAQLAMALSSRNRDAVLTRLVHLLADA